MRLHFVENYFRDDCGVCLSFLLSELFDLS